MALVFKKLVTTLAGGTNTYTFTDELINDNSVIEVYTDNDDVYPVDTNQSGHSVTVELSGHSDAVQLCITINNAAEGLKYEAGENITISEDGIISSTGGSGASTWEEVADKPFSYIGEGLTVEDDTLIATGGGGTIPGGIINVTPGYNYISINGNNSKRYGDIVTLSLNIFTNTAITSGTLIASIPREYAPSGAVDFSCEYVTFSDSSPSHNSAYGYINQYGNIYLVTNKTVQISTLVINVAYCITGQGGSGGSGGGGGVTDYSQLTSKPSINNITLIGNKSLEDLGIASASDLSELSDIVGTVNAILEEV